MLLHSFFHLFYSIIKVLPSISLLSPHSHSFSPVPPSVTQLSIEKGDRILVFSQSLLTLDLIENFLANYEVPLPPKSEEKPPDNGANYGCLEDLYRYNNDNNLFAVGMSAVYWVFL